MIEAIFDVFKNPVVSIGVATIIGGALFLRKRSYAPDIASFATTTGIAFTFIGIVIAVSGLSGLDESDIKSELDKLLKGIYVAFVPSIVGAGIAVLTHFTHLLPVLFPPPSRTENKTPSGVDEQILQEIQNLNKNLVGDGETSLITRLEKFQLKVTEKQDELINEFQGLSKQIAEKIIDALSESMTELNKKLGEQFGENFGKFAEAIPQLLEWQETHRKTLADMQALLEKQTEQLQKMLDTFNSSQQAFEAIAEHTEAISRCANNLSVKTNDIALGLAQASDSVAVIKDSAEKLDTAAKQFTESVQTQIQQVEQQSKLLSESAASLKTTASAIKKAAENIDAFGDSNEKLHQLVEQLTDAMRTLDGFRVGTDRFAAELTEKADAIESNMKRITDSAVQQLANNLRGISEALVNDYTAVHDAIKQIREHHEREE